MEDPINSMRVQIARKYIGQAGIHGVGASRTQNAIRLYMQPSKDPAQKAVLAAITKEAAPFNVLVVEEAPPRLTSSAGPASIPRAGLPPAARKARPKQNEDPPAEG
jgi:hypothetical protein